MGHSVTSIFAAKVITLISNLLRHNTVATRHFTSHVKQFTNIIYMTTLLRIPERLAKQATVRHSAARDWQDISQRAIAITTKPGEHVVESSTAIFEVVFNMAAVVCW